MVDGPRRRLERPTGDRRGRIAVDAVDLIQAHTRTHGTPACRGAGFRACSVCANTKHTAITPSTAHSHQRHGCNLALWLGWNRLALYAAAGLIT